MDRRTFIRITLATGGAATARRSHVGCMSMRPALMAAALLALVACAAPRQEDAADASREHLYRNVGNVQIAMLPVVYEIPYHYANPVSGRTALPPLPLMAQQLAQVPMPAPGSGAAPGTLPPAGPAASPDPGRTARQDLLVTPPVAVPPPGMPPDVAAALREIGPVVDGARTTPLYAPLHAGKSHDTVQVQRDLAYGPDPRHRADVFTGRGASGAPRPLLVFSYGGGFRGGAKSSPDTPFYDNIGYWAAGNGMVGVTINYRLAPEFTWPAGAEDIARVVAWLREQAPAWGADPAQIFLWGHSSGAAHVADYLVRTPDAPVRAAILMSGIYSLGTETSIWSSYYGEDVSQYPARSSLPRLIQLPLPIMAVWAELDAPNFIPDTEGLIEGRRAAGRPVVGLRLPNHSHLSEAYAIGTDDTSLAAPLLQFIRDHSARRQ